ncbi:MAG: response regulator transcription factor [Acidobacteriota bacterium]|nr:response regulator transcription factor [Acidobacteriota bacterium]
MKDDGREGRLRIGLVATDPMRVLGLETMFSGDGAVEIVPLSIPGVLDDAGVSLILVDSACVDHVFELLAMFLRARPQVKLIVLGLEEDHAHIQRIIGAGAKGYLAHTAKESEIRLAIEIVQDGSVWAPRKVLAKLLEAPARDASRERTVGELKITNREAEVLRLLVAGHPNRSIAEEMGIDLITVKAHVGRLMRKVGVANRIELSVQAVSRKLVPPRT